MPDQNLVFADRVAGALVGLLVGDALGVPYEFHGAASIPPADLIDFDPPKGFRRAHPTVPPGTWSDDGAQALCLLESLLLEGDLDLADFGERLLAWRREGHMAVDRHVFDIGVQTSVALRALESGTIPEKSGPAKERDNGNGSLMRVLPLTLWHRGPDSELVRLAAGQSLVTHGHPRSQVCCALYCLWARALLEGESDSWDVAVAGMEKIVQDDSGWFAELEYLTDHDNVRSARGTGYVADTLWSTKKVLDEHGDYAGVVRGAVALGNDTDTTAAVAGGLAGIRHGLGGIPESWRKRLRGDDLYRPLLRTLLSKHGV